ncbi:MAG: hypothetical protein RIR00_2502 [Pseudomonadota bacterium]
MGLLANGFRDTLGAFQTFGATQSNNAYPSANLANYARTAALRNISAGEGITDDKVGLPMGAAHPIAWMLPQKAGALSSHNLTRGESSASLTLVSGRNMAATSDGASTASATLQLVVSLQGSSAGSASVTGNILAALGMAGSGAGSCTASATIGALAWAAGEGAGSCTVTLTSYATGRLYGSISPFTELSPENLASAVIAAAEATPLHADIRKVNAYAIDGDGSGTPWGPV